MADANGTNGGDQPRKRGRPPKQAAASAAKKPEQLALAFNSKDWSEFLRRYEPALSDLREAQAECREAKRAAGEKGLNKLAGDFILKLRGRVANDKLTAAEAMKVVDQLVFLAELEFDAAAGIERMRRESEGTVQPAA